MSSRTEIAKAQIEIDGRSAKQVIAELAAEAKQLRDLKIKAFDEKDLVAFKNFEKEIKDVEKAIKSVNKQAVDVTAVMKNLNGTSLAQLKVAHKAISTELDNMKRGTTEYAAKAKQLQLVEAELRKVKTEMHGVTTSSTSMWSKAANGFNKYFTVVTAGLASITGLVLGLRSTVTKFNEFEEEVANLSALTGLAGDDLDWLSDKAKELSTSITDGGVKIRSGADEIVTAFTKMGSAKPELLKDKDGLAQVTEQALILKEASKGELEPTVKSLANTMNQFSADASEASRYINVLAAGSKEGAAEVSDISESIVKFGAAAAAANISVESSVGLIETLAEKGITAEIAGRQLRGVLLKMQTGADDTNPAIVGLQTALENLSAKNMTAAEMVKFFGEENYVAAQILLENTSQVEYFTKAVTGTSVALEQAKINTSTNAAALDQAKNKAYLMAIELGEKLAPALTFSTNAFTYFLKALLATIEFVGKHKTAVLTVTTAVLSYAAAVKIAKYWDDILLRTWYAKDAALKVLSVTQGILTGKIKLATVAQKAWNLVSSGSAGAIGLLVAGITAAVTALISYTSELTAAEKAQKAINNAKSEAKKNIVEEIEYLGALVKIAKDETKSKADREAAMKKINAISPEYLGNLKLEEINTTKAKDAVVLYIAELERKAKVEALIAAIAEEEKNQVDIKNEALEDNISWYEKLGNYFAGYGQTVAIAAKNTQTAIANQDDKINDSKETVAAYRTELEKLVKTSDVLNKGGAAGTGDASGSGAGAGAGGTTDPVTKVTDAYEKLTAQLAELKKEQLALFVDGKTDEAAYMAVTIRNLELQIEKYKELADAMNEAMTPAERIENPDAETSLAPMEGKFSGATDRYLANLELQLSLQEQFEEKKKALIQSGIDGAAQMLNYASERQYNHDLQLLNQKYDTDKARLDAQLAKKVISQEQYDKKVAELDKKKAADELKLKRKAATRERVIAQAQIIADTAQAVFKLKALAATYAASFNFPGSALALAQIPIVLGSAAIQSALVWAAPMPQAARGKYPVRGASDNTLYNADYVSNASTGLLRGPTILAGEQPEIIVDTATTRNIMMNFPALYDAILMMSGRKQFASGLYPQSAAAAASSSYDFAILAELLSDISQKLDYPTRAKVVYTDFEEVEEKVTKTRNLFNA